MKKKRSSSANPKLAAPSSNRLEAVKNALELINKQYGDGAIMRLGGKFAAIPIDVIKTGCLPLDIALGVGGLPRGRITEIFGPEASGKTTLSLHVIREAQRLGGTAAFIDAEHALDPSRAVTIGVDLDNLLVSQPDNGEQALEIVDTLVRSNALDVIVVDSVAALVPKSEIDGEMGDGVMGAQARLMSQALRKLAGAINKSKTVIIFTNQIRHKIGVMFGNPETTPGGLALKFYASIRIDIRKIANIKTSGGDPIGSQHRARVIKNKVAPPFKEAEFEIMNTEGISVAGSLVDLAVDHNFIVKSGAFFKIGDDNIQGREAAKKYLADHPKITSELETKIWQKVKETPQSQEKAA